MIKKILGILLITSLVCSPVFAERITLQDGNGNEVGTAGNPLVVSGGSSGGFANQTFLASGSDLATAVAAASANTMIELAPFASYDLGTSCLVNLDKSIAIIGQGKHLTKVTCSGATTETTGFQIDGDSLTPSDLIYLRGFSISGDDFLSAIRAVSTTETDNLDYDNIVIKDIGITITDDEGATITGIRTNVHGMTIEGVDCSVTSSAAGATRCYFSEFDEVGGASYLNNTTTYIRDFSFFTSTTSGASFNRALDFYHKTANITNKAQTLYARNGRVVSEGTVGEACKITNDMNGASSGGHEVYMHAYMNDLECNGSSNDLRDGSFQDATVYFYLTNVVLAHNEISIGTSTNDGNPVFIRNETAFGSDEFHFYPTTAQSQGTFNELMNHTIASGDYVVIHPPTVTPGIKSWVLSGPLIINKGITLDLKNGAYCSNYLEEGSTTSDFDAISIQTAEHVSILNTCVRFNSSGAQNGIGSTSDAQGGNVDIKNYFFIATGTGGKFGIYLTNLDYLNIDGAVMDISLTSGATSSNNVRAVWADYDSTYSSPPTTQYLNIKNVTAIGVNDEGTVSYGLRIRDNGFTGTVTAVYENNDIRWTETTSGTTYAMHIDGNGVNLNIKSGYYSGADADFALFNSAVITLDSGVRYGGTYGSVGTMVGSTDGTFLNELRLGHAGVRITHNSDGALTLLGLGNGSDEDLTVDLDTTANTAGISSSTGLDNLALSGIFLTSTKDNSGWSIQSAANQACTTTCTSAAVMGFDSGTNLPVSPSSALADACLCAGAS